jgi:mercuric ion transport protein
MRNWSQAAAMFPGIGVSLLPKLACPACWPAYAGLLSSVGLGFLISTTYLLPLTSAFLLLALSAMAIKAKTRRGYGPLVLGVLASVGVVAGKFVWESGPLMYGAVGLLVVASAWNAWPRRRLSAPAACPACEPAISVKFENQN